MDRKNVIRNLGTVYQWVTVDVKFSHGLTGNDYEKIAGWVSDALAMLKEQGWISVEERLPKSMANKVLVYLQHEVLVDQIGYGHYEKFKGEEMWYDLEFNEQFSKRGYTVTHWMPLPKSPKGERLALS